MLQCFRRCSTGRRVRIEKRRECNAQIRAGKTKGASRREQSVFSTRDSWISILFRENADRRHFRVVVIDENAVFTQAFQLEFAAVEQDDFEVNARDDGGRTWRKTKAMRGKENTSPYPCSRRHRVDCSFDR